MKKLSGLCIALSVGLSTTAAFARGGMGGAHGMGSSHMSTIGGSASTRLALDVCVVRTGELAARKRDEHGRVLAIQAILVAELLDQISPLL
jgi:hypothetical protein